MSILFHSAPIRLGIGSIILPGNYGRIIRERGEIHPHWEREQALEKIRAEKFADKPSRLDSCFACATMDTMSAYIGIARIQGSYSCVVYEVEQMDRDAPAHHGNFCAIQPVAGYNMSEIADIYWSGTNKFSAENFPGIPLMEVVTHSPLRIIRLVTE